MLLRTRRTPSGFIEPCLPSPANHPPSGPGWIHEITHDGFRLMARRGAADVRLLSRNGHDWSPRTFLRNTQPRSRGGFFDFLRREPLLLSDLDRSGELLVVPGEIRAVHSARVLRPLSVLRRRHQSHRVHRVTGLAKLRMPWASTAPMCEKSSGSSPSLSANSLSRSDKYARACTARPASPAAGVLKIRAISSSRRSKSV